MMSQLKKSMRLLVMATPLALAACGTANTNRSLDSVHQPVVRMQVYSIDLATAGGTLTQTELARLDGWFSAMQVRYGDKIAIDDPASYANQTAHAAVADLLSRRGMLLADAPPQSAGAIPPGAMRVTMLRATASVPGCPDWSTKKSSNFNGATSANYGCANNSNLAAMVADPMDLVRGATPNTADPLVAAKAIRVHREADPTGKQGLSKVSTTGGN